jgi:nucleoside-diphosphate-sugar epimerase
MGNQVKVSTRTPDRLPALAALKMEPFLIDIGQLPNDIQAFLDAEILIINIPSKDHDGFAGLLKEIEKSKVRKLVFVSSTSVYEPGNKTISESDGAESSKSPLVAIENLFRNSEKFETTIVRFGGLVGYSRNPGRFFAGGRVVANPDAKVNLIHRDDCIGILSQIVEQSVWAEAFNCCADTHPTKREFYSHAAASTGFPVPEFAESDSPSFNIISNHHVKQRLGYTFLHPDLMKIEFGNSG